MILDTLFEERRLSITLSKGIPQSDRSHCKRVGMKVGGMGCLVRQYENRRGQQSVKELLNLKT